MTRDRDGEPGEATPGSSGQGTPHRSGDGRSDEPPEGPGRKRRKDGRPPVLVLQEGPSRRVRRRRWMAALLAVAVLLTAAYLGRDAVERWTGVEIPDLPRVTAWLGADGPSSGDGAGATAATGPEGTPGEAGPAGAETPPGPGPAAAPAVDLQGSLDSLAAALQSYRERHGDFQQGRLGCPGLTRGFVAVTDRFVGASRAFDALEGGTEAETRRRAALADRYRRLASNTDSVNRLFAASGCTEAP